MQVTPNYDLGALTGALRAGANTDHVVQRLHAAEQHIDYAVNLPKESGMYDGMYLDAPEEREFALVNAADELESLVERYADQLPETAMHEIYYANERVHQAWTGGAGDDALLEGVRHARNAASFADLAPEQLARQMLAKG